MVGAAGLFGVALLFAAGLLAAAGFLRAAGLTFFFVTDLRAADFLTAGFFFFAAVFLEAGFFAAVFLAAGFFAPAFFFAGLRFFALAISCLLLSSTMLPCHARVDDPSQPAAPKVAPVC